MWKVYQHIGFQCITFKREEIFKIPLVRFPGNVCSQHRLCLIRLLLHDAMWHDVKLWRHSWHCVGSMVPLNVLFLKGLFLGIKLWFWERRICIKYSWNPLAVSSSRTCDITSLNFWSNRSYLQSQKSWKGDLGVCRLGLSTTRNLIIILYFTDHVTSLTVTFPVNLYISIATHRS